MDRLRRFRDRARLLRTPGAQPFARRPLGLRRYPREFHFDIETHPLLDGVVYLHGVLDVRGGEETYVSFFAEDPAHEGKVFADAWAFLQSDPDAHIFYYSKFERTSYRMLAGRYPSVCTRGEVEEMFSPSRATDLLGDAVLPHTEWPTHSMGVKSLAKFCGFSWSDVDPSGASSIAWFDQWLRTRDPIHRERLEAYNRDDVRATVILLNRLIGLPVSEGRFGRLPHERIPSRPGADTGGGATDAAASGAAALPPRPGGELPQLPGAGGDACESAAARRLLGLGGEPGRHAEQAAPSRRVASRHEPEAGLASAPAAAAPRPGQGLGRPQGAGRRRWIGA